LNTFFKLLFLLLITTQFVYASVTAKVDYKTVELGEMVTFYLDISGEDITRPNIQRVCDTDVISTSSQTSIQVVNGEYKKSYLLGYKFVPIKSCKIDPIEIEIDGKKEFSNSVDVKVKPVTGAKDLDFVLTLSSDKKELFVGETFDLTLTFKQRTDSKAVDSEFEPPKFKGFWVKNESSPQRDRDGKYTITKIVYTMAPQRAGKSTITRAQMRIASRSNKADSWGAWIPTIKWKTYFSNELDIDVKPLPSGLDLVGDFSITARADTKVINANEAVNVKVEVLSNGNLEDIKSFKPTIEGVSAFDEKIVIKGTKLTQNIALVGEKDFVIPPFSLKYFDPETKKIKTISTKEIAVKVKNEKAKEKLTIKRDDEASVEPNTALNNGFSKSMIIIIFFIGLASGVLIMLLKPWSRFKTEKRISIKEPKILLMKLLPFKDNEDVKDIVDILEKSLYSKKKLEYDKKALKEIMKKYDIS